MKGQGVMASVMLEEERLAWGEGLPFPSSRHLDLSIQDP